MGAMSLDPQILHLELVDMRPLMWAGLGSAHRQVGLDMHPLWKTGTRARM